MTSSERFFKTLLFDNPNKIPFMPGGPRESTLKRWHSEGLDKNKNWFDEYDYTYIRSAKDFVTRKWHKFPVENEADWDRMKTRYSLETEGRFAKNYVKKYFINKSAGIINYFCFNGPFWQVREWCGFEGLCILMADRPEFVDEMVFFWENWISGILTRIIDEGAVPDRILVSEDMAYKAHSSRLPRIMILSRLEINTAIKWRIRAGLTNAVQPQAVITL